MYLTTNMPAASQTVVLVIGAILLLFLLIAQDRADRFHFATLSAVV